MKRLLALALALVILFLGGSQAAGDAGIDAGTNAYRIENGRPPLETWSPLQTIANMRVIEVSTLFSHVTDWQRLFDLLPDCLTALGENIAHLTTPADSSWFVSAWIASPTHAANMLGWGWDWQASAMFVASDGRTYGVQLFADGCSTSPPVIAPEKTAVPVPIIVVPVKKVVVIKVPVTIPDTALPPP